MKAIFITVLLLTLMVAPSFAQPLKIPDAMLGTWCLTAEDGKGEYVPLSAAPLNSNGVPDCGSADYYLVVDRKGYGGHEVSCNISKIVRRGDVWQVRSRCNKEWTETVRWQLIKNGTRLKYQVIQSTNRWQFIDPKSR